MKRIKHFDVVRVICFIAIIYYHIIAQLPVNGICSHEAIYPFVANANMQVGTFAVAVFFMISGASLMYTTQDKFEVGTFYLKRYIRLLIPFYVVTFMYYIVNAIRVRDLAGVYVGGIPVWRWIFTIFGMDEWVSMHGIVTFSRGIGEWFLGALVILSFLFPLLRYLMQKNTKIFMTVAIAVYLFVIVNYDSSVLIYMSLPVKGFDFILGMWYGLNWQKISPKWKYVSILVLLIFLCCPIEIPMNQALKILIPAAAFLLSFSLLEDKLQTCKLTIIQVLSKYSYELFLVHHIVIYAVTPYQPDFIDGIDDIIKLVVKELIIIVAAAVVAKFASDFIIKQIWKVINYIKLKGMKGAANEVFKK